MKKHPKSILYACLLSCSMHVGAAVIGQTYDVKEPDALTEIEQKAASVDWNKALNKPADQWTALQGIKLPFATEDRSRSVIPFYTTEFDIKDKNGRITYPKGFTFNPLEFVTLPQRILIIDPSQEQWLQDHARVTDQIIFTHGNVFKAKERLSVPVFILDDKTRSRLDIKVVPTIVEQKGKMLVLHEFEFKEQNK